MKTIQSEKNCCFDWDYHNNVKLLGGQKVEGDQEVSVHLMITTQKAASNV